MLILKYWDERLKMGLVDFKTAYQFPQEIKMDTEMHQGKIYFRVKGSSKRISYNQVKRNLVKRLTVIDDKIPF